MAVTSETWTPDNLFGGSTVRPLPEAITVALGESVVRGEALGKITEAVGAVTADAGNTGDGTCVVALPATDDAPAIGDYVVTCEVIADTGPPAVVAQFRVVTPRTPQGHLVFADGTPQVFDGVQLTLTEGATEFALADEFTFSIAAGSGEMVALDTTSTDGSQRLFCVASEDVDASAAAVVSIGYVQGEFNTGGMTFAAGDTYADFEDEGRLLGIFFRTNIAVPS